ncbi:MAG TPA: hypothetical protein VFS43_47735, partial [Polyangiaceae bacterium]|nr:hypothetical protein [Polyangiaceae bacterium]
MPEKTLLEALAEVPDPRAVTSMSQSWADAAGSLVTTAADLATFWRELERGSLLKPEQMAELHRAVPAPPFDGLWPGVRYGL